MSKENLNAYIKVQQKIDKHVKDFLGEDSQTMKLYYRGLILGLSFARAQYEGILMELPELNKGDEDDREISNN